MLPSILKLTGVKQLCKDQKQVINGGSGNLNDSCHSDRECAYPLVCAGCYCRPPGGPI